MENETMKITRITEDENGVTAFVEGRIDSVTAPDFLAALETTDREKKLTVDAAAVEYISSAGIRALIVLEKTHPAGFRLIHAGEAIADVLRTTGLLKYLCVETVAEQPEKKTVSVSEPMTFRAILSDKVSRVPERTFMVWLGEAYTYRDIETCSQIIAADLSRQGVKRYSHVALFSENSANLILAFFAVQKLGAVAVMMNPSYTPAEVAALAEEGAISHFCCGDVTDKETFLQKIMENGTIRYTYDIGRSVDFRTRSGEYEALKDAFTEPLEADDPGVMIFTSGSTGTPKGALHSCYSMCIGGRRIADTVGTTGSDRLCHTLPLFHIGGLCMDFMNALLSEATLYFPPYRPGSGIVERMQCILDTAIRHNCTVMNGVPTSLLSIAGLDGFCKEALNGLHYMITGSQPITEPQMKRITESYPSADVYVVYGMTELLPATVVSSRDTWEQFTETVGKAVDGVCVEIRDAGGGICPTGTVGEVYLSGDQAIACYYQMNVEKQPVTDGGYIKTGDLGFLDEDGYLHLSGRSKDIIIRGGENIVPGEIVRAAAKLPYISDVYVCGVPDELMGEKVAAAVIMKNGCEFRKDEIKKDLAKTIARHKIPSYFLVLESFPLLANGKLDKVTLKKLLEEAAH